ncbi:imidazole glycerol phosphate synthase subunit HisH [soil metagenome]
MRVVVCDPGVGNVRSVVRAIERASGAPGVVVTRDPAAVRAADYVVVPGQGAFGAFVRGIEGGLGDALREHLAAERPYLGICLGMQVLFGSSDEAEGTSGLGVLRGHVARLAPGIDPVTARPYALPHIGWNAVEGPVAGERAPYFYFAHSYAVVPDDPTIATGTTTYGEARFVSAVAHGSVRGVQFHPEKSQREGLALLSSFFRL